jgi:ligand-binding SRPBCC domain-containing protein
VTPSKNLQKVFQYTTLIPTSLKALVSFHEAPAALLRLTPPPLFVQIIRDERISLTEGEIEFILWFGPLPVRWKARHELGPFPTSFVDRMLAGPMAAWEHQHLFYETAGGVELTDRITYAHKQGWRGWLTRLVFDGWSLRFLFWYRHWRTRRALRKR